MGGSPAHQKHMLSNLATSLFTHGKITTTEARARRLRPYAEKLITFAKRGDLHARRQVLTVVPDKDVVYALFSQIGPSFADRNGGYTRITKLGPRKGDAAPMAVIELVTEEVGAARPPRRRARRATPKTAVGTATVEETTTEAEDTEASADASADVEAMDVDTAEEADDTDEDETDEVTAEADDTDEESADEDDAKA